MFSSIPIKMGYIQGLCLLHYLESMSANSFHLPLQLPLAPFSTLLSAPGVSPLWTISRSVFAPWLPMGLANREDQKKPGGRVRFWYYCPRSLPVVYQTLLVSLKSHSYKAVLSTLPPMALGSGNWYLLPPLLFQSQMDWSITPDFLKFCPQFVDSVFIKLSSNYSFECVTYFMPQPYDIPVLCSHIIAMIKYHLHYILIRESCPLLTEIREEVWQCLRGGKAKSDFTENQKFDLRQVFQCESLIGNG